jgi:DNA-binding response OmpR family regulator
MHEDPTRRYRLLAVEDDSECAAQIVRVALRSGYEAFPIADARSLRETISRWRPDVITLDLCLPDVDGLEVLTSLKSIDFAGRLIIISAQPDWFRNQAARLAHAHGLRVPAQMSKPVQLDQLQELLTTIKASLVLSPNPLGADPFEQAAAQTDQHH